MVIIRWFFAIVIASSYLSETHTVHAWGAAGHRIVGEIALHYLTPMALEEVEYLLGDQEPYDTLAESSVWADSYARRHARYAWLNPLHYVDIPVDADRYRPAYCPLPDSCVVRAIERFRKELITSPDANKRLLALRMLAHLVGDIHQPLHVTHPDGRGGTRTEVTFLGHKQNVHAVWDTAVIETVLERNRLQDPTLDERWGWPMLAHELRMEITPDQVSEWSASDPDHWADESLALAKEHAFAREGDDLGEADYLRMSNIVRERMKQAGVRLAALLNAALLEQKRGAGEETPPITSHDANSPPEAATCDHPLCDPGDYYASLAEIHGPALLVELAKVLETGHRRLSYGQVWEAISDVDQDPEDPSHVLLFYSGRSQAIGYNASHSGSKNAWNREHIFPKSHGFKKASFFAYTDIHHLMPADASINSTRGNKDFAEGGDPVPQAPDNHTDEDSFEPRDPVKGNTARAVFYMAARYDGRGNDGGTPDLTVVTGETASGQPRLGDLCTLLRWHEQDPPDERERLRNAKIHANWQGNRNPFIDHPEWVREIWGPQCPPARIAPVSQREPRPTPPR